MKYIVENWFVIVGLIAVCNSGRICSICFRENAVRQAVEQS